MCGLAPDSRGGLTARDARRLAESCKFPLCCRSVASNSLAASPLGAARRAMADQVPPTRMALQTYKTKKSGATKGAPAAPGRSKARSFEAPAARLARAWGAARGRLDRTSGRRAAAWIARRGGARPPGSHVRAARRRPPGSRRRRTSAPGSRRQTAVRRGASAPAGHQLLKKKADALKARFQGIAKEIYATKGTMSDACSTAFFSLTAAQSRRPRGTLGRDEARARAGSCGIGRRPAPSSPALETRARIVGRRPARSRSGRRRDDASPNARSLEQVRGGRL